MNITMDNYVSKQISFEIVTRVNTTKIEEKNGIVEYYQGIGIQIYNQDEDLVYAEGIESYPSILLFEILPFETITWEVEEKTLNIYESINYINITLWHNYNVTGDYNDFELTESWKFNLLAENYGQEEQETEEYGFHDMFFLGFIGSLFLCPLSIVAVIKMRNPKMLKITIFTFIILISCFYILMDITPFGG